MAAFAANHVPVSVLSVQACQTRSTGVLGRCSRAISFVVLRFLLLSGLRRTFSYAGFQYFLGVRAYEFYACDVIYYRKGCYNGQTISTYHTKIIKTAKKRILLRSPTESSPTESSPTEKAAETTKFEAAP